MRFLTATSLFIFFLFDCFYSNSQDVLKLRIDPSNAFGGTVSNYFSKIDYIPLETNKQSLFGDISQLLVTDSSYVIFDRDTRSVLFFTKEGKFINKINTGNDNVIIYSYGDIILLARASNSGDIVLREYSTKGKILTDDKILENNNALKQYFFPLKSGFYATFNSCNTNCECSKNITGSTSYMIDIYKDDKLYKSLLPYDIYKKRVFCELEGRLAFSMNMILDRDAFYISSPLEHIIYQVTVDTAIAKYQIVVPKKYDIMRHLFETDSNFTNSDLKSSNYYKPTSIRNVSNINLVNNFLLFKVNYFSKLADEYGVLLNCNFIYDFKNEKLSALERITPDKSSYYLRFFNEQKINLNGLNYHKGCYFSTISSLEMFAARDATKSKNPQYPPVLQEYFKTQTRKSNPVIVRMKLKE